MKYLTTVLSFVLSMLVTSPSLANPFATDNEALACTTVCSLDSYYVAKAAKKKTEQQMIEETCNVPAHAGIKEACNAYHNPPAHIVGYTMDTQSLCYTLSKSRYNDIMKMSEQYPDTSYAAYDAAAEEALRQGYYHCQKGSPVMESTTDFLKYSKSLAPAK